jgi:hypothetical protein
MSSTSLHDWYVLGGYKAREKMKVSLAVVMLFSSVSGNETVICLHYRDAMWIHGIACGGGK